MTPEDYAAEFMLDVQLDEATSDRSLQTGPGISGFTCREQFRRALAGMPYDSSPNKAAARAGSYWHDGVFGARERASLRDGLGRIYNRKLICRYPNGVELPGTPDEIDPAEPSVTDGKSKNGLATIRRLLKTTGLPDWHDRVQVHSYYLAALQAGLVPEDGIVRILYGDRSGVEETVVPWQEPFSMAVIDEAVQFLDDVLYARRHDEEASRDRDYSWCENWCGYFLGCRGGTAPTREYTDPLITVPVALYDEGKRLRDEGERLRVEAKGALDGIEGGLTPTHEFRWTVVHPSEKQAGYKSLFVRERAS